MVVEKRYRYVVPRALTDDFEVTSRDLVTGLEETTNSHGLPHGQMYFPIVIRYIMRILTLSPLCTTMVRQWSFFNRFIIDEITVIGNECNVVVCFNRKCVVV